MDSTRTTQTNKTAFLRSFTDQRVLSLKVSNKRQYKRDLDYLRKERKGIICAFKNHQEKIIRRLQNA